MPRPACKAGDRIARDRRRRRSTTRRRRARRSAPAARPASPVPMRWRIERGGRAHGDRRHAGDRRSTTAAGSAASRSFPGQPPEMTSVRYGFVDGLTSAVTQTWQMSVADREDARQDDHRPGLAQEPERAGDDRRLRRPVGAPRPRLLPRLSRRRQRQSRRAQPAAAAGPRWRTPDVLSFRGRDRTSGLRVVARQAAARRGCHHAHDDVPGALQRHGPPAGLCQ